jgi:hypothetical protein
VVPEEACLVFAVAAAVVVVAAGPSAESQAGLVGRHHGD